MAAAHRIRRRVTTAIVIAFAAFIACAAVLTIDRLQSDSTDRRDAEQTLVELRLTLAQIQDVPWGAAPDEGDDPDDVRSELTDYETSIRASLAKLSGAGELPEEEEIVAPFERTMGALRQILDLVSQGRSDETDKASSTAAHEAAAVDAALQLAGRRYREDANTVLRQSRNGSAAVIALLFAAFVFFYLRATRARRTAEALAAENRLLLDASRVEAHTDALTGLNNRRALIGELDAACSDETRESVLVLLDLNGFKAYNDGFGHPAGDALLALLGGRLTTAVEGIGSGYRIGGDEFCVLAPVGEGGADAIAEIAVAALSEEGPGFSVSASHGTAVIPTEARSADDALRIADKRMYVDKETGRGERSRASATASTPVAEVR